MFGMLSLFGELLCDHFIEPPNSGSVPAPNISGQSKVSPAIFLLCGQPEGLLDGSRSPNYWFREFLVNRIFFWRVAVGGVVGGVVPHLLLKVAKHKCWAKTTS